MGKRTPGTLSGTGRGQANGSGRPGMLMRSVPVEITFVLPSSLVRSLGGSCSTGGSEAGAAGAGSGGRGFFANTAAPKRSSASAALAPHAIAVPSIPSATTQRASSGTSPAKSARRNAPLATATRLSIDLGTRAGTYARQRTRSAMSVGNSSAASCSGVCPAGLRPARAKNASGRGEGGRASVSRW